MDSAGYHKANIGEHALKPETWMLGYGTSQRGEDCVKAVGQIWVDS